MNTHQPNLLDSLTLVRCRPGAGAWFLALMIAGFGALSLSLPFLPSAHPNTQQHSEIGFALIGAILLIPALVGMIFLLRMQIRATDIGLRWRTWGDWKSATWDEVTDFYDKSLPKGQKTSIIETPAGNISLHHDMWTHWKKLREIVAQRAYRALNREWAEQGARPQERWPLVFDYNTSDNRQMGFIAWTLGPASIACGIWFLLDKWDRVTRDFVELGWLWGLGTLMVLLLIPAWAVLLPALLLSFHFRALRGRKSQRITATAEGLTYEDGVERIQFAWEDISLCYTERERGVTASRRHVVVGKQRRFDYTASLKDVRILHLLLSHRAPEAVEKGLDLHRDEEDLRGETETLGEHIYHYRTRTNRALLWFVGAFACMGFLAAVLAQTGWTPQRDIREAWIIAILLTLPVLWAWWRYQAASIRTDATGITQVGMFGKRFVAWNDVRDYYLSGGDIATFANVEGTTSKIRFWYSIAGRDKLFAEIARRAAHCPDKEWKIRENSKHDR